MLTERQLLILQVIIDDFIETAQPIGSRSIAKKENITYSPATVRNEMADLEDMGFLEKPIRHPAASHLKKVIGIMSIIWCRLRKQ